MFVKEFFKLFCNGLSDDALQRSDDAEGLEFGAVVGVLLRGNLR